MLAVLPEIAANCGTIVPETVTLIMPSTFTRTDVNPAPDVNVAELDVAFTV
jgi:hypothetical protein